MKSLGSLVEGLRWLVCEYLFIEHQLGAVNNAVMSVSRLWTELYEFPSTALPFYQYTVMLHVLPIKSLSFIDV